MANGFSGPVEKIVNNYLDRLNKNLRGFPAADRDELVREIHSHIYESFRSDPTENEVDRILKVLDRLGEPADVISSRVSTAMVDMGKKKKLPFYILAGVLIAFFGVPIGMGGIGVLIGLTATILALIASFYITAFSLILAGWLSAVVLIIKAFRPEFLDPYVNVYPLVPDPAVNLVIYIFGSFLIAALGVMMLWVGRYLMRGIRFAFRAVVRKIRDARRKRLPDAAAQTTTP